LTNDEKLAHIVVLLALDFIKYLTPNNHLDKLKNRIKLLSCEMLEKNP